MRPYPLWLHALCVASLLLGIGSAAAIAIDVRRRPQPMVIMNVVWPVCALFGSVLVLFFYVTYGRASSAAEQTAPIPLGASIATGTLHCGAGCSLGDLLAEWIGFAFPGIALWFGWQHLFANRMYALWVLDFICAFAFGVLFQYFAIAPMRHLPLGEGIKAALKADSLSLIAWQFGMYGAMAALQLAVFAPRFGAPAPVDSAEFWCAMQLAMLCGFITSYPMNWWLVRHGIKERM